MRFLHFIWSTHKNFSYESVHTFLLTNAVFVVWPAGASNGWICIQNHLLGQITHPASLTSSNRAKLKRFDITPACFRVTRSVWIHYLSRGKTQYGTIFSEPWFTGTYSNRIINNSNLETLCCIWLFRPPTKTLFSIKLDFRLVTGSMVVACSCTSRRADRPLLTDDLLTGFRGVSDALQHVGFTYFSQ